MAKSLTIKNKNNLILYPKTVSSLVYDNSTGNTVKQDLDSLIGQVAELLGVENAFFGGIVGASTDIATDYTNNEYSGTYLYMVGTDMSSLVAYQYTGSGSPTQLFGGITHDFTDYSDVKQLVTQLESRTDQLLSKIDVIAVCEENGFFVVDENLSIVAQITKDGFDVDAVTSNFVELLESEGLGSSINYQGNSETEYDI